MDGIHDLGGKLGFGAVAPGNDETPFHADWEARMLGIAFSYLKPPDYTTPRFRYMRELEDPVRYLTRPYFDQWYKAHACMLIAAGVISIDELASGESDDESAPRDGLMSAADVQRIKFRTPARETGTGAAPRFAVGERVRVRSDNPAGHTRVPAYVRGATGTVTGCHGEFPLDDALALNEHQPQHLYTVGFRLADLFAEQRGSSDRVHVELWESYLADD